MVEDVRGARDEGELPLEEEEAGFGAYGLRDELMSALARRGFEQPTPVQQRVLASDWRGRDMIVRARTGSGKTLAFLLPLLQDIRPGGRVPRILILAPTRELAQQTAHEAEWLARDLRLSVASLVGGMEIVPQLKDLHHGASIIVGTPGRVRDHVERGSLDTEAIQHVVLDEGDLMLDMGFRDELEAILGALPEGTRWLFSATMPEEMRALAERYLTDPLTLSLVEEGEQHADILHRVYMIPSHRRLEGLVNILIWEHPGRSLVFCHTKMESLEIAQKLQDQGFSAAALQGDMTQNERNAVLASFKSGSIPCLVATNVAARGLDVEGVTHVIQLGLPDDQETFVHRSGRTGRAGNEGTNLILLSPPEAGRFRDMLRSTQMKVEWRDMPALESIRAVQRQVMEQNLLSAPLDEEYAACRSWADDLLSRAEPGVLVAKLLAFLNTRTAKGYPLSEELERERERRRRRGLGQAVGPYAGVPGSRGGNAAGRRPRGTMVRLRSDRGPVQDVGRVLGALCTALKVERREIGAIRLKGDYVLAELMPLAISRLDQGRSALARWGFYPDGLIPQRREEGDSPGRSRHAGAGARFPRPERGDRRRGDARPRPERPPRRETR
ncbi:MAG: DEAD/DEAH box helicase [Synergistaceae bacterium]|nr:DEAD/DEAH box helicase [Synergistaceae bacterium]